MFIDAKVKKEIREQLLENLNKAFSKDSFIDLDLLNLMTEITQKTGYEVAVLINRKGIVTDVYVGTKNSVQISTQEYSKKGFNGLRVVHTHPNGNSTLSQLDNSMLLNNKYDCICAIGVLEGKLTTANVGYIKITDKEPVVETVFVHNPNYINKFGLLEKILQNETDYIKNQQSIYTNSDQQNRAVLVVAEIEKRDNLEEDLEELQGLCQTAGIVVLGSVTQKRAKPDGKYLIGEGKLVELKNLVQNTNANLVVFDNELSGSKQANLVNSLGVDVIDRSMLILDIFAKRAKTSEGKLQVELAQLKYLLPRANSLIRGHQGGSGVGLRGPGESKIEINKRIIENNIIKKERELEHVKQTRQVARSNRLKSNKKIVCLVGYTNSGKSTLMNTLSGAGVYEKDELFATLDTTTRNVWLNSKNEILLIDTVGFINKLPHEFIEAFSSTLEESVFADVLLHVVDVSNPNYQKQIDVVNQVLQKIKATSPIITVYNKIDKVPLWKPSQNSLPNSVAISAKRQTNIENLKNLIIKFIN